MRYGKIHREGGYYSACRERRTKATWAGVGPGDAFRSNLDYHLRLPAQRQFYQTVRQVQAAVAQHTDTAGVAPEARVKPQLSPFYTSYPSTLAAPAAIGLTAFLEFEARVPEKILVTHLAQYLENPAEHDDVGVDPHLYREVAKIATKQVQVRLLLEDLSRSSFGQMVEIYRLFSASQQTAHYRSVPEMLKAMVLYGDILPDWRNRELHPMTRFMLNDLLRLCNIYFDRLAQTPPHLLVTLGVDWVKTLCRGLAPYLPDTFNENPGPEPPPAGEREETCRFRWGPGKRAPSERIAPLNGPHPPTLFDPTCTEQGVKSLLGGNSSGNSGEIDPIQEIMNEFAATVTKAGGQTQDWEDIRADVLEKMLRQGGFSETPIQGNPVAGHEVSVRFGKEDMVGGEIFDRAVELCEDDQACAELLEQARPITEALRKNLYPNVEQIPETERLRPSGSLDAGRLAVADFSPVIFRRYRIKERAHPRGMPVVLIAADGSGSLNHKQMQMLKLMTAGWLESTVKRDIQVLAGLYHSGSIRPGLSGPLVQWIYHPQKTPALTRKEAVRALASLPPSGTGAQSDALSLAFMLEEARRLARGRMIYLILLSDCAWNQSFRTAKTGQEEVFAYLETAYQDLPGKLHVTLVALGMARETGFENLLDKVLVVSQDQLIDPAAAARQIGTYVASCLRERRRWVRKS